MSILVLALLLGALAGLRALSPPAILAWAVHFGWIVLEQPLSYIGSAASVAVFSVLAFGELIADKTPNIPNRTSPSGLAARIVTGALVGACLAAALGENSLTGGALGSIGAVAGCFGGYQARIRSVKFLRLPDLVVALIEDTICIAGSLCVIAFAR